MLRSALASLRYRKARLVLSSLAITAGVAFVTGTLVMGASITGIRQQLRRWRAARGRRGNPADTRQQPPRPTNDPSIPPSVLAQIGSVPGVASAAGRLVGLVPLLGSNGKAIDNGGRDGIGINVPADPALRGFTVTSGHVPGGRARSPLTRPPRPPRTSGSARSSRSSTAGGGCARSASSARSTWA